MNNYSRKYAHFKRTLYGSERESRIETGLGQGPFLKLRIGMGGADNFSQKNWYLQISIPLYQLLPTPTNIYKKIYHLTMST